MKMFFMTFSSDEERAFGQKRKMFEDFSLLHSAFPFLLVFTTFRDISTRLWEQQQQQQLQAL